MQNHHKPYGVYEKYIKRSLDIICALLILMLFWWLYVIVAILVKINLGSPIFFMQERPGKDEKLFKLYKYRTMTNERDKDGNILADEKRLTRFGRWLRSTSMDELPEIFNILKGEMSIVGPRPQLVRDMVFMTTEQRKRHEILPGLTGLAQVNGRNRISWEEKLQWDLQYLAHITFLIDAKIVFKTFITVLKKKDIKTEGMMTAEDFGDYLLRLHKIDHTEYMLKQSKANTILQRKENI